MRRILRAGVDVLFAPQRALPPWVVLAYHSVPDARRFDAHLDVIARSYDIVGLTEFATRATSGGHRPCCVITFDDGDRTVYDIARPALRERGFPAIAFVIAGLVGTQDAPWWVEVDQRLRTLGDERPDSTIRRLKGVADDDRIQALQRLRETTPHLDVAGDNLTVLELRELTQDGVEVGNHSLSHPLLDKCSDAKVVQEVRNAHERLTSWLGHPPRAIAYPNGNVDSRAVEAAMSAGYEFGFLFDHRVGHEPLRNPLRISRVRVDARMGDKALRSRATGVHPAIHHALRRR